MKYEQVSLERFWAFVAERQAIWYRRFVEGRKPPWTEDPILQRNSFCNVYRELDYGTVWARQNILLPNQDNRRRALFQTAAYRGGLNRPDVFDEIGLPEPTEESVAEFFQKIEDRRERGLPSFSTAYGACGNRGKTRIGNYREMLRTLLKSLDRLYADLWLSKSLESAVGVFAGRVHGIANFIGYEILADLMYYGDVPSKERAFTEDDWVYVGPGAIAGLKLLYPDLTPPYALPALRVLRMMQEDSLPEDFHYSGGPISLANLEGCFCEFRKYEHIRQGRRSKRLFRGERTWDSSLCDLVGVSDRR